MHFVRYIFSLPILYFQLKYLTQESIAGTIRIELFDPDESVHKIENTTYEMHVWR